MRFRHDKDPTTTADQACKIRENPYLRLTVTFHRLCGDFDMNRIFSQIVRLIEPRMTAPASDVAQNLMERAEAVAGSNPYQAAELRRAASAYLSVVR